MKRILILTILLAASHPALAYVDYSGVLISYFFIVVGLLVGILSLIKKANTTSSKTTSKACYFFVVILGITELLLIAFLFLM